jgi:hypothetical protein
MKQFYRIGGLLLIYGMVVYLITSSRKEDAEAVRVHLLDPVMLHGVDWFPGHGLTPQERHRYLRGVEDRVLRVASMETEHGKRMRAAQHMEESRRHWQWELRTPWQELIKTNYTAYEELLATARQSPNGTTPCTLCDGKSYMPCILCEHQEGKCIDCNGRGRRGNEYCPTCVGTGRCYLCSGYGKMFCPFCDDGTIDIKHPRPAGLPPIN